MGGCASRPRELDPPATLPGEKPTTTPAENPASQEPAVTADAPAAPEKNDDGDEAKKEEPLVDLSETPKASKTEGDKPIEAKDPVAELVAEVVNTSDEDKKADKQSEEKAVASGETAEKVNDAPKVAVVEANKDEAHKSDVVGQEQLVKQKSSEEKINNPAVVTA